MKLAPNDNRPILAVAVGMVVYEAATEAINIAAQAWDLSGSLVTALTVLAGAVAAAAIGLIAQYIGDNAPWAASSHYEALKEALATDPHELHAGDLERLGLGPEDLDDLDVPWSRHEHGGDDG